MVLFMSTWNLVVQLDCIAQDTLGNVFCFARLLCCCVELIREAISPPCLQLALCLFWRTFLWALAHHTWHTPTLWPEVNMYSMLAGNKLVSSARVLLCHWVTGLGTYTYITFVRPLHTWLFFFPITLLWTNSTAWINEFCAIKMLDSY